MGKKTKIENRKDEPSQALPRQLSRRESQAVKFNTKVLGAMRKFPVVLLPLPLGEVASRSDDGEGARQLNSPSHGYAVPAPSEMGPLAWRYSFKLKWKVSGRARGSLPEGAVKAVRL